MNKTIHFSGHIYSFNYKSIPCNTVLKRVAHFSKSDVVYKHSILKYSLLVSLESICKCWCKMVIGHKFIYLFFQIIRLSSLSVHTKLLHTQICKFTYLISFGYLFNLYFDVFGNILQCKSMVLSLYLFT
jgi:hypothetical protein